MENNHNFSFEQGASNMNKRSGTLKKNFSGEAAYYSFVPSPLPPIPPIAVNTEVNHLLIRANIQLAALEATAVHIPNMNLFVSMYVRKVALMSSQIEGTQATLEDVMDPLIEKNANLDVAEVINYIRALEFALEQMQKLPLCVRLIKETHAVLMEGVRGHTKAPGEFRRSQNWIGGAGSTIKTARYIPPMPEDMSQAMSDLEKYINTDDDLDVLIRAALIHYQFETIHPFLDGNGRIGRLLILLFLIHKQRLSLPALYISYFLKRNRMEYYDRMTEVRNKGNYEQWIIFFLEAVYESAKDAVETIDKLIALHDQNQKIVEAMGRGAKTAKRLFTYIEAHPIIDIQKTAAALGITYVTVSGAVKRFLDAGLLAQSSGDRRNRLFAYKAYLDLLREGT
jgi:Fic family protein